MEDNNSAIEQPYDPSMAAISTAPVGRGRGRGRGRGGGGTAIAGIAELDATLGRGAAPVPSAGGGKPLPPKKDGKDFRGPEGLFKKGDWTCNACGNVNWERRQTCNKCQNTKPNIVSTDEVGSTLNPSGTGPLAFRQTRLSENSFRFAVFKSTCTASRYLHNLGPGGVMTARARLVASLRVLEKSCGVVVLSPTEVVSRTVFDVPCMPGSYFQHTPK